MLTDLISVLAERRDQVPLGMTIENMIHAPVFSGTLAHENSKIKIRQKKWKKTASRKELCGKKYSRYERSPDGLIIVRAYHRVDSVIEHS